MICNFSIPITERCSNSQGFHLDQKHMNRNTMLTFPILLIAIQHINTGIVWLSKKNTTNNAIW